MLQTALTKKLALKRAELTTSSLSSLISLSMPATNSRMKLISSSFLKIYRWWAAIRNEKS